MQNKRHLFILVVAALLIATIACDISFNSKEDEPSPKEIEFELTRQSLQVTQTALAKPKDPPPDPVLAPIEDTSDDDDDDNGDADEGTSTEDCYYSQWTGDETIPDGTKFDPGDSFVKTWTIRNAGTCKWTTDFKIEFEDGDKLGAPTQVKLSHEVSPGDTYVLEVPMTAPSSDGDYVGVWRFKAADGTKMGKYWVKITVGDPAPSTSFAVTSVTYYMPHTTIDMGCPGNLAIKAEITASGAGEVTYYWKDSETGHSPTRSVTFAEAGKKIVDYTMKVDSGGDHWAKVYIDEPNHQWFGQKNFHVNCN